MRGLVLLLSLTTLLAACRAPAPSSSAASPGAEATQVAIELPDDPAVGPADVVVRLSVSGEPGVYRTHAFAFDMAGDWVLTVEATLPDGRRERAEAATTVRRP